MKYLYTSSAIAGIVSPLVLATVTAIFSSQRPGYSHLQNALSDLGAIGARYATLMDWGGIIPAGLLTAFSAIAVQRAPGAGAWSVASGAMLVLGGAGLAATAISPWRGDPSDLALLPNRLHLVFALTGFFLHRASTAVFRVRCANGAGVAGLDSSVHWSRDRSSGDGVLAVTGQPSRLLPARRARHLLSVAGDRMRLVAEPTAPITGPARAKATTKPVAHQC